MRARIDAQTAAALLITHPGQQGADVDQLQVLAAVQHLAMQQGVNAESQLRGKTIDVEATVAFERLAKSAGDGVIGNQVFAGGLEQGTDRRSGLLEIPGASAGPRLRRSAARHETLQCVFAAIPILSVHDDHATQAQAHAKRRHKPTGKQPAAAFGDC